MKKFLLLSLLLTSCNLLNPDAPKSTVTSGLDTKKYPFRVVEIQPNPEGTDIGNEYFTLRNISADTARLDDWSVKTTSKVVLGVSFGVRTFIAPSAERKVSSVSRELLINTVDTLRLFAPDKTLVQTVTWANAKDGEIIKP